MAYIYKTTNKINGKSYIGKTEYSDPYKRFTEHINEAKRNRERTSNRAIYRAIRKYGIENFSFDILEENFGTNNCEREQYYIDFYKTFGNGYNETKGGDGRIVLELNENKVCEFYKANGTIKETAKHFNCDVSTIRKILIENGIPLPKPGLYNQEKRSKKVARVDLKTKRILEVFDCINDAEIKYNCGKHISSVCKGKRKSCKGFGWEYID